MSANEQLDLFCTSAGSAERTRPDGKTRPVIAWNTLDDERLIAAFPAAGISDSVALAAEAGRRGLGAAVPALDAVCRRFAGFGVNRIVPEQAAALDALATIGGSDAAQAVARLIAKSVVQGPCLQRAVTAAVRLGAKLPAGSVLGPCGTVTRKYVQMPADAVVLGGKQFLIWSIFSMTSIHKFEWQPLARSDASGAKRLGRFSLVIFTIDRPRKSSLRSLL